MAVEPSNRNLTSEDVFAFLTKNPDKLVEFLSQESDFLDAYLSSIESIEYNAKDKKVINLVPKLTLKAREEARQMTKTNRSLVNVAAENMVNWQQLHIATLSMLASANLSDLIHVINREFPSIFELNQCHLITESDSTKFKHPGFLRHKKMIINRALDKSDFFLGMPNESAKSLMSIPAPSIAIIRLPDRLPMPIRKCVLLLGGKTRTSFQPNLGSELLILLAEMVGVALTTSIGRQSQSND